MKNLMQKNILCLRTATLITMQMVSVQHIHRTIRQRLHHSEHHIWNTYNMPLELRTAH